VDPEARWAKLNVTQAAKEAGKEYKLLRYAEKEVSHLVHCLLIII
jgi:hypothetical protein